jgi:hypothetical protein
MLCFFSFTQTCATGNLNLELVMYSTGRHAYEPSPLSTGLPLVAPQSSAQVKSPRQLCRIWRGPLKKEAQKMSINVPRRHTLVAFVLLLFPRNTSFFLITRNINIRFASPSHHKQIKQIFLHEPPGPASPPTAVLKREKVRSRSKMRKMTGITQDMHEI